MQTMEELQHPVGWDVNARSKDEEIVLKPVETEQEMFNRVAFGGERILYNFNGAEVAIVPLEDYEVLEGIDQ
ncbi:hypothetical protein [Candidatus Neptunichlamydia sp. REUL1]|uniref:hypothetical protein n=1 Tax=Candidatus Neptunichlamydia sp. REUL1 TaxID=3064277 RepID=UPI0029305B81|nr:hypothetical protein [Candidatus Neptunochlamydia sp. REUL1]